MFCPKGKTAEYHTVQNQQDANSQNWLKCSTTK